MAMIYVSHLLPDREMREIVERTGAGVESIEFGVADNLDNLSLSIKNYRMRMRQIGVSKLIIHGPFLDLNPMTFDSQIQKVTKLRYSQAYTAARELGAKKIVYHTCFYPDAYLLIGWAQRMADFFQEFLEERTEVEVVMENVFDRKWEPLLEVKERVKAYNFSLCLDIGHAHCYSSCPVTEWADSLGESISHIHIHDNKGDRDTHLGLGQGNIPLKEIFHLLTQKRRNLTYTIECGKKEDVISSWEYWNSMVSSLNKSTLVQKD